MHVKMSPKDHGFAPTSETIKAAFSICKNVDLLATNLIGQAVQRTSQTVHGGAEGQVGVRQGTTHQVAGVGTDIASFVIAVTFKKRKISTSNMLTQQSSLTVNFGIHSTAFSSCWILHPVTEM